MSIRAAFDAVRWAKVEKGMGLSKAERDAQRALLLEDLSTLERGPSGDELGRALGGVELALYDQGSPSAYVEPVVPMLVSLLPRAEAGVRRGIVELLASIGTLSSGGLMRRGEPFDPSAGWGVEFLAQDGAPIRAIDAHAMDLLRYLDDEDSLVRERMAFLLTYLPSARPAVRAAFESLLARERDEAVITTLLVARAIVARAAGESAIDVRPLGETPAVRAAASIGRALGPDALDGELRRAELVLLLDDAAARRAPTSFSRGALALLGLRLLAPRAFRDADVRDAFIARAGATEMLGDGPHDERPIGVHASLALAEALPARDGRTVEELDLATRDVLVAFNERPVAWPWGLARLLENAGYPNETKALARYCGLLAAERASCLSERDASGVSIGERVLVWVCGEGADEIDAVTSLLEAVGSARVVALVHDIHARRFEDGLGWDAGGAEWRHHAGRDARAMTLQLELLVRATAECEPALDAEIARLGIEGPPVRALPGGINAPLSAYPDLLALARALRDVRIGRAPSIAPSSFSTIRMLRTATTGLGPIVPYVREAVGAAPMETRAAFAIASGTPAAWGFWLYADLAPTDAVVAHVPTPLLTTMNLEHDRVRALEDALRAAGRDDAALVVERALVDAYRRLIPFLMSKKASEPPIAEHWRDIPERLRDVGLTKEADALLARRARASRALVEKPVGKKSTKRS